MARSFVRVSSTIMGSPPGLVVVVFASDVAVEHRRRGLPGACLLYGLSLQAVLQYGFDGLVRMASDSERPFTGKFQTLRIIPLSEPKDAQTAAEALFRMLARGHDLAHQGLGGRPGFPSPGEDPL